MMIFSFEGFNFMFCYRWEQFEDEEVIMCMAERMVRGDWQLMKCLMATGDKYIVAFNPGKCFHIFKCFDFSM